jgi:hypothetical protein
VSTTATPARRPRPSPQVDEFVPFVERFVYRSRRCSPARSGWRRVAPPPCRLPVPVGQHLEPSTETPNLEPQNRPPAPSGAALRPAAATSSTAPASSSPSPSQRRYARRSHDPLPTASAINGRKAPPQRPPCTPSRNPIGLRCQRPHGLISESSWWVWTDNQGPTASHQHACWAVDGIHAVEDCARSNRGAPGCESRELSTAVLQRCGTLRAPTQQRKT